LAFNDVQDILICFDDIERKSKNLDLNDFLGLVNYLKEQRRCKIFLILNENELGENEEIFKKYTEKIADREIVFAPLIEESFTYIFRNAGYFYYETIRKCCFILGIKNLRILKRIQHIINELIPYLENKHDLLIKEVLGSVILFIWSYYDKENNPPSIEFITEFNYFALELRKGFLKQGVSPEDQKHYRLLGDYGYHETDELDKILISYIQNGYLPDGFVPELEKKNNERIAQAGANTIEQAFFMLENSFQNNETEVVEYLKACFEENVQYITLAQLQDVTEILIDLDRRKDADELIDRFPFERLQIETMQRSITPPYSKTINRKILKKIKLQLQQKQVNIPVDLMKITEKNKFTEYLDGNTFFDLLLVSEEEYYKFFSTYQADDFDLRVRVILRYAEYEFSPDAIKLKEKVYKILRKIAQESKINKWRVTKRWRIPLKKTKNTT
jgi:hypothetical protein